MMTYLQLKAERVFLVTAFMTVCGTLVVVQGVVLMIYPFYRTVMYRHGNHPISPPTESQ